MHLVLFLRYDLQFFNELVNEGPLKRLFSFLNFEVISTVFSFFH